MVLGREPHCDAAEARNMNGDNLLNVAPAFGTVDMKKANKKPSDNDEFFRYSDAENGVFWACFSDNQEL